MFITIDYDEGDQESYRAVVVDNIRFESGNVVQDWLKAVNHVYEQNGYFMLSSSCDHFIMDGSKYEWIMLPGFGEIIKCVKSIPRR